MKNKIILTLTAAAALVVALAGPARAHVTVQPSEAVAGSFARFVVRVPNERDDASTTRIEVQLPESLVFVSFQPKPGWTRTTETEPRTEPVEVFGEQVTDFVASVTWEGGAIAPGEFEEFGFTARVPEEPTSLEFPAIQTYSSGEEVTWIGPEDSDAPAARVSTFSLGEGDAAPGQLELLAELASREPSAAPPAPVDDHHDDEGVDVGVVLGGVGIAVGAVAIFLSSLRRREG